MDCFIPWFSKLHNAKVLLMLKVRNIKVGKYSIAKLQPAEHHGNKRKKITIYKMRKILNNSNKYYPQETKHSPLFTGSRTCSPFPFQSFCRHCYYVLFIYLMMCNSFIIAWWLSSIFLYHIAVGEIGRSIYGSITVTKGNSGVAGNKTYE